MKSSEQAYHTSLSRLLLEIPLIELYIQQLCIHSIAYLQIMYTILLALLLFTSLVYCLASVHLVLFLTLTTVHSAVHPNESSWSRDHSDLPIMPCIHQYSDHTQFDDSSNIASLYIEIGTYTYTVLCTEESQKESRVEHTIIYS